MIRRTLTMLGLCAAASVAGLTLPANAEFGVGVRPPVLEQEILEEPVSEEVTADAPSFEEQPAVQEEPASSVELTQAEASVILFDDVEDADVTEVPTFEVTVVTPPIEVPQPSVAIEEVAPEDFEDFYVTEVAPEDFYEVAEVAEPVPQEPERAPPQVTLGAEASGLGGEEPVFKGSIGVAQAQEGEYALGFSSETPLEGEGETEVAVEATVQATPDIEVSGKLTDALGEETVNAGVTAQVTPNLALAFEGEDVLGDARFNIGATAQVGDTLEVALELADALGEETVKVGATQQVADDVAVSVEAADVFGDADFATAVEYAPAWGALTAKMANWFESVELGFSVQLNERLRSSFKLDGIFSDAATGAVGLEVAF